MQWWHTCGGGADVAALGGTGQIYAAAVVPAGDGVKFAMLDVAVQALPIEGLEGEYTCLRHRRRQVLQLLCRATCISLLHAAALSGGVILLQL